MAKATEATIENISADILRFIENYSGESRAKRVGIFGSVSRREENPRDIDIVAEYDYTGRVDVGDYRDFCAFCGALQDAFATLYQMDVDVADGESLLDRRYNIVADDVGKEVVWIYESGETRKDSIDEDLVLL